MQRRGVRAELLMVGTELLLGQTVDTNASFIAEKLAEAGVNVYFKTTVGDNRPRLVAALSAALLRADVVITSGGLGPTEDDLTRDAVAGALGLDLIEDEEALAQIEKWFRSHARAMAKSNRKQALMPEGATVLQNDRGTAPGFIVRALDKAVVCLPGVPHEMRAMLTESVLPYLREHYDLEATLYSRILRFTGIGESDLEQRLVDLFRSANPTVAPYASLGEVKLRLTARAEDRTEAENMFAPVEQEIRRRVGEYMYGTEDDTLEAVVGKTLQQHGRTVGTAESCTGGLVAKRLTDVPGSSAWFPGGVVAYGNDAKKRLLNVPEDVLERHGAVSPETAAAMAEGAARLFDADYGLGVTGIAGPGGGSEEKPVGLVYVAVAGPEGVQTRRLLFGGERAHIRRRASQSALDLLRRQIRT